MTRGTLLQDCRREAGVVSLPPRPGPIGAERTHLYTSRETEKRAPDVMGREKTDGRREVRRGDKSERGCVHSCRLSSAWVRLRTNAPLKLAGGSMILTGLRAGVFVLSAMEGKGRSGRDVGKECVRAACGRGCTAAARGDETRGRDAEGLKGEGAATAAMTSGRRARRGEYGLRVPRRGDALYAHDGHLLIVVWVSGRREARARLREGVVANARSALRPVPGARKEMWGRRVGGK